MKILSTNDVVKISGGLNLGKGLLAGTGIGAFVGGLIGLEARRHLGLTSFGLESNSFMGSAGYAAVGSIIACACLLGFSLFETKK